MASLLLSLSGQRDTVLEEFTREVDGWLPFCLRFLCLGLLGRCLLRLFIVRVLLLVAWMAGGWREFKALLVSWFDGLARIFSKVEDTGVWPEGLLDAYSAMIPKTDGGSGFCL